MTARFTFESDGFHYEVLRTLLSHVDYDPLFVAECRPLKENGPRRLVLLKRVEVPPGRGAGSSLPPWWPSSGLKSPLTSSPWLSSCIAGHHPLDPPDAMPPEVSKRTLQLVSGVRAEQSSWTSVEVLADRLFRFGPEDVERIAHRAPAPLMQMLHRALQRDPAERYQSAAELRDDLRSYLRGLQRPFNVLGAAVELSDILKRAAVLTAPTAYPIELGVLPEPEASSSL